jgi:uncharacterized protein YecT (DUF1311 family)
MKVIKFFCLAALLLPGVAMARSLCTGNITHEIEVCAKNNFEEADGILNENYKSLVSRLSSQQRQMLVNAEREWAKYKDMTCQGAYDSTNPGEEAGIDKWSCLDQITRTRNRELVFIDVGIGSDDFFKSAEIVAKFYENGNENRFIDRLVNKENENDDASWASYVKLNCALAVVRIHEDEKTCVARQYFYRY